MKRALRLVLLATIAVAGACVDRTPSDLLGSVDLILETSDQPEDPLRIVAEGPGHKFRSQINDGGDTCELDVHLTLAAPERHLYINTYPDEVIDLLAGGSQTLTATTHRDRSIVLNAATIFFETPDADWYSTRGSLTLMPLPAPGERHQIQVTDVALRRVGSDLGGVLSGTIETTYLGAVQTDEPNRACPQLAPYPGGLVF